MRRIRTKLVLALLAMTLLPVFPVYYVVKSLVRQSLEVGYNKKVGMALDAASAISREFYGRYRQETLRMAKALAGSPEVRKKLAKPGRKTASLDLSEIGIGRVDLYTRKLKLVVSQSTQAIVDAPRLYQTTLAQLSRKNQATLVEGFSSRGRIVAFAPIGSRSFLILLRAMDPDFIQGAQTVVSAHQMFKTLDFFQSDVSRGFLLAFFAIYVPLAIATVLIGIYFSRKLTSPLLQLVQATREVAAGDWDFRIRLDSRDEVGQLGEAFNKMVSTLKDKQQQVVALEKMAVWREIARVLAHEIKNPLTPIQLMVQQMHDKYPGEDPEYQKLLAECNEIVNDEIESLRTLVREFSEFARMPRLEFERGNLNELVTEARRIYPNDNIDLELDDGIPEFSFDHEKLRRVLINLLENGMDSIREKGEGEIHVATRLSGDNALLICRDTGNGIPLDIREKICEPYFSTKKTGMGLGMVIVKRIVMEHGGRIEVDSEVGQGATFTISLPPQRPRAA